MKYFKSTDVAVLGKFKDRISIKDNLSSWTCADNCTIFKEANITSWLVRELNTNGVQAVDDGLRNDVKGQMYNFFETWSDEEDNADKWDNGQLSVSNKRILLQNWFAQAITICFQKCYTMYRYHKRMASYLGPDDQGADMIKTSNDKSYKLSAANDIPVVLVRPGTSGACNAAAVEPEVAAAAADLVAADAAPASPTVVTPSRAAT